MAPVDFPFYFRIKGIAKGKQEHLDPALGRGQSLEHGRVLQHFPLRVPFPQHHVPTDQLYKPNIVCHAVASLF
jgi:hypothetical protein